MAAANPVYHAAASKYKIGGIVIKAKKHFWTITFRTFTAHVKGTQKIRVQIERYGKWQDVLFEGTLMELESNKDYSHLRTVLEYEEIGTVMTDNDVLVIGIQG